VRNREITRIVVASNTVRIDLPTWLQSEPYSPSTTWKKFHSFLLSSAQAALFSANTSHFSVHKVPSTLCTLLPTNVCQSKTKMSKATQLEQWTCNNVRHLLLFSWCFQTGINSQNATAYLRQLSYWKCQNRKRNFNGFYELTGLVAAFMSSSTVVEKFPIRSWSPSLS